jgi:hypothetical protein
MWALWSSWPFEKSHFLVMVVVFSYLPTNNPLAFTLRLHEGVFLNNFSKHKITRKKR